MKLRFFHLSISLFTFFIGVAVVPPSVDDGPTTVSPVPVTYVEYAAQVNPYDGRYDIDASKVRELHGSGLATVEIRQNDPEGIITERVIWDVGESVLEFELDLGEDIENQIIALGTYPDDPREFKVEQQFETSMAVGDEGPHLDMVDWKHFTSEWQAITKLDGNRFLTSRISESDQARFPKVTQREIRRAVSKIDRRWGNLARSCTTPQEGPCYVGLSRISFRISASEDGQWRVIKTINFSVPLGC